MAIKCTMHQWFQPRNQRRTRTRVSRPVTTSSFFWPRLQVRSLEDRTVPATITVANSLDTVAVVDHSPACPPSLTHPLLARLVTDNGLAVGAKLGWTDVARFAQLGIPATNFGPGDAEMAHTAGEFLDRVDLERCHRALVELLTTPGG